MNRTLVMYFPLFGSSSTHRILFIFVVTLGFFLACCNCGPTIRAVIRVKNVDYLNVDVFIHVCVNK